MSTFATSRLDSSLVISPTVNLTALDGQRGVGADHVGDALHVAFKLGHRHHAVDEAHDLRFASVELARGIENLLGEGGPDNIDEALQAGIAVTQAELGGRHGEPRIVRADAQVATGGEPDAAADAIAADHGDGRLGKFVDAGKDLIGRGVIGAGGFLRRALAAEFGNIGAGDERLAARAGEDDDADVVVAGERIERGLGRLPHIERHRIVPRRIVEGDDADAAFLVREHLVGLGHRDFLYLLLTRLRPCATRRSRAP